MAKIDYDMETNFGGKSGAAVGTALELAALAKRLATAGLVAAQSKGSVQSPDWSALTDGDFGVVDANLEVGGGDTRKRGQAWREGWDAIYIALTTGDAGAALEMMDKGA